MLFDHLRGRRILVLTGHTNKDFGTTALACGGWSHYTNEAEVNLDLAMAVAHDLRIHSREPGEETDNGCMVWVGHGSWQRRAKLAEVYRPDAVIEIHCNAFVDDTVRGHECWVGTDTESEELAECIIDSVSQGSLIPSRGVHKMYEEDNPNRALFEEVSARPCVLVECGFLTNREDCGLLTHDGVQAIIAFKIGIGINSFFAPTLPTSEGGAGGGATADSPDDD